AAAGLAIALSGGGSSKHRATPPPAPYPNAIERGLLKHVPAAIRSSCRRKSHTYKTPFTFGATGGIGCDGTGAVASTVSYYQFPSTARMNAMYQDSRSHNDVQTELRGLRRGTIRRRPLDVEPPTGRTVLLLPGARHRGGD